MDQYLLTINNPDQQYQRQVEYILKQLKAPAEAADDKDSTMSQEDEDADEDENDDDYDSEEEEDEHFLTEQEDEMIFQQMGPEQRGEMFLEAHFKGTIEQQERQIAMYNDYMMIRQQNAADLERTEDDDDLQSLI